MKILIVKTSALGDIIQAFPVVSYLNRMLPEAQIDWVVKKPYVELIAAHPLIRQALVPKQLKKDRYDLVIDLQGNIKSGLLLTRVIAHEKVGFSLRSAPEWPNALFTSKRYHLNTSDSIRSQYLSVVERHFAKLSETNDPKVILQISEKEKEWVESELAKRKRPRLMVCLGSTWENKKLSLSAWKDLLGRLEKEVSPSYYFVWGNEKEKMEAEALFSQFSKCSELLPRMSLPVWQHMIAGMDGVLAVDSSALHLAATCDVPTFSFFGPSSAQVYKPTGEIHRAYEGACPYGVTFTKRCPKLRTCASGACLKNASFEALYEETKAWLSRSKSI